MAQNNILLDQYRTSKAVAERNAVGLNAWAGYTSNLPIPTEKPNTDWVRARIVADRIPQQMDSYVLRTLGYFMQDPATNTNIWQFINFNNEATEVALSSQVEQIIGGFMPRFAAMDVTQSQVDAWYEANGFPATAAMGLEAGRPGTGARPQ